MSHLPASLRQLTQTFQAFLITATMHRFKVVWKSSPHLCPTYMTIYIILVYACLSLHQGRCIPQLWLTWSHKNEFSECCGVLKIYFVCNLLNSDLTLWLLSFKHCIINSVDNKTLSAPHSVFFRWLPMAVGSDWCRSCGLISHSHNNRRVLL